MEVVSEKSTNRRIAREYKKLLKDMSFILNLISYEINFKYK